MIKEKIIIYKKWWIPILILIISINCSDCLSSPEFHAKTIQSLDEKKMEVTLMAATTATVSSLISVMPEDTATPIANETANLTMYLLLITCVLYFEKYLLTITGWAVFKFIVPLACLIWMLGTGFRNQQIKKSAMRVALTGVMLFAVVPVSEHISCMIRNTYEYSIEEAVNKVKDVTKNINENAEEKSDGILKFIWDKIKGGVSGVVNKLGDALNEMVEAIAIMIVTSCIFPLLTLFVALKIVKLVTSLDVKISLPKRVAIKKEPNKEIIEIEEK